MESRASSCPSLRSNMTSSSRTAEQPEQNNPSSDLQMMGTKAKREYFASFIAADKQADDLTVYRFINGMTDAKKAQIAKQILLAELSSSSSSSSSSSAALQMKKTNPAKKMGGGAGGSYSPDTLKPKASPTAGRRLLELLSSPKKAMKAKVAKVQISKAA